VFWRVCFYFVIGLFVDYALLIELQTVMYSATPWKSSRHPHITIKKIRVKKHATVFAGVGRGGGWHFYFIFENTRRARPTVLATALVFTKRIATGQNEEMMMSRSLALQSREART
jgi:hypothetical protein